MFIKRINKIFEYVNSVKREDLFLALMVIGIPFSIKVGNLLLIIAFLFAIYILISRGTYILKKGSLAPYLFPIGFFLVLLISTLFSKDIGAGFRQVEKNLLLVIISFTLIILQGNRKVNQFLLLGVFTMATFISTLFLLIIGIIRILNGASLDILFFHEFGAFFDLHPVYIAICVSVSIFIVTDRYFKILNKRAFLFLPVLLFFYTILILCASKAIIITFIVLHLIHLQIIQKYRYKYLSILILTLFIVLIGITKNFARIKDGLHFNMAEFNPTQKIGEAKIFTNLEKANISDLELRYVMFKIGLYHLWAEEKLIYGYGIGDVQHYTDYHYMIYNLAPGWYEGYNLHNQYLQFLVTFGVFILLFFAYYLFYSFKIAIRSGNLIYLLFLILMSMVFLVESILSRNKGIIIFYFFNTIFILKQLNENRDIRN